VEQLRLGLLSSHGGTNMQAIIDACNAGRLGAKVCVAISNNSGSFALQRAVREGIPRYHLSGKTHADPATLDAAILAKLEKHGVSLVVLAGYMKLLGPRTVSHFRGRILNIHPALLPKFGGRGLYGVGVHRAVLAAGERVTGVTIHLADERFDHGTIVAQTEVPVLEDDTAESLSGRVLRREHSFFVDTLERIERGEIDLGNLSSASA
jgi:phosphoribosylglycinamide formyltransferase-1